METENRWMAAWEGGAHMWEVREREGGIREGHKETGGEDGTVIILIVTVMVSRV